MYADHNQVRAAFCNLVMATHKPSDQASEERKLRELSRVLALCREGKRKPH